MFRESMADDHGMLFVFEDAARGQLLDEEHADAARPDLHRPGRQIKAVKQGEPFSEALISPGEPVRFVLELKAGTADKDGIEDGDQVRHPAINAGAGAGNAG